MELQFKLSGALLFSTKANYAPPIGSKVTIRTESYKKGLTAGSLISFPISEEFPPEYDYSESEPIVHIDVNNYEVLEAGPDPD